MSVRGHRIWPEQAGGPRRVSLAKIKLHEHHVGGATTGLTQHVTEDSQGLMRLPVERGQHGARLR